MINNLMATSKDLIKDLDNELEYSDDPSEAIDAIAYFMGELPHEYIGSSFAERFRNKFRYWTLDTPTKETPGDYYGIYLDEPELSHAPAELNMTDDRDDGFKCDEYARRNAGKHWIFRPSRKRNGADWVRKATRNDERKAYEIAVKMIKKLFD